MRAILPACVGFASLMVGSLWTAPCKAQVPATGLVPLPMALSFSSPEGHVLPRLSAEGRFLAPLSSLSENVQRAHFAGPGFSLQCHETGASVTALVHSTAEFIILDGERPRSVRGASAPARLQADEGAGWDLAHLIRRDRNCATGGTLALTPTEGAGGSLLLFGDAGAQGGGWPVLINGVEAMLPANPLAPLVVPSGGGAIRIELGEARLDAAMFAELGDATGRIELKEAPREGEEQPITDALRVYPWTDALEEALAEPGSTATLFVELASPPSGEIRSHRGPDGTHPLPPLREESKGRGIDFVHFEGDAEQLDIRPTMGPGAAWGDVNGDGLPDLVVLQGAGRPGTMALPDRLYLGAKGGQFVDATGQAGLGAGDAGMGALLVDLDGDGHLDLYCANYGKDRLFLGAGDGTFQDATELLPPHDLWSASVTAADSDGDGDLDLYITSYLDYDLEKMPPEEELGRYRREDPVEMLPFAFPGQRNVFLENRLVEDGQLGFKDITEELGLLDVQGRGMQTVFWDFDSDGDEDLYVANDVSFNVLFRNEGDGTFKDVSFSTGLDDPRGGMGLAVGDVDLDGDDDVFLTNWQLEANALYLNGVKSKAGSKRRRASFRDYTVRSGLGPSGVGKTSWGAELFDLDLDGDLDLYVANGYTSPDYESTGICVGQTDQLFLGDGTGRFEPVDSAAAGIAHRALASRGAIGADFDRDGDVDLFVTANNGRAHLLVNVSPRQGHFLCVRLAQPGPNPRAIGADVSVRLSGGEKRRQSMRAGQGYLTGNGAELHFGLGDAEAIETIEVTWPDGTQTEHPAGLDQHLVIRRP